MPDNISQRRPDVLPGWVRHTHPEGAPYFFHPGKRIFTDANASRLQKVMDIADGLLQKAAQLNLPLHADVELVIGLINHDDGRRDCLYYFVDHHQQLLFWVHAYKLSNIFANVRGVETPSHKKLAITTQYWTHLELYPDKRIVKAEHYEELKGILIHASSDTITSKTSVAPFDSDELTRMLDLMDKIEGMRHILYSRRQVVKLCDISGSIDKEHVYAVCVMARFMRLFNASKFINFYGQPGARLNADQSVYTTARKRRQAPSILIKVADVFMFGSPSTHAKELEKVWVDQSVNFPRWKGFIGRLSTEWGGFTIYSTVMLAVDVSFLAIPPLGGGNNSGPSGSQANNGIPTSQDVGAIIATYASILCVVGSLLVSVHLSDRVRGHEHSSAKEVVAMMVRSKQSMLGTDGLAIMYSLPYAFLVWGMLFFILALTMVMFANDDKVVLGTLGPAAVIVGILALWPLLGHRGYPTALFAFGKRIVA
ncbi:hypothetical protein F5I97DRAFT_1954424 [Phlebopus sp. FC_14]|nr:hypothetical protein F5I97DRAFT_1954424 [Phlebopus sp. FC_14]